MKKLLSVFCLTLVCFTAYSQNGLEKIIVEKYYISDANDAAADADGGVLPVGSVTYRIYADMLPGYRFQAVYGVPDHEMRIETSTLFFNNEDRGAVTPTYTKAQAANNTVMLDSWLSVGAACGNNFGVLKDEDDGQSTVINSYSPQVLQNTDPAAGIPLTQQDGIISIAGRTPETVTLVGITTEAAVFDAQNDGTNGPLFSTTNGSWASLNGSVGADSTENKVLIAQITTDGIFSFSLNIQIGTPTPGGVENYVAQNPTGAEIQLNSLTYSSLTGVDEHHDVISAFDEYPNPVHDVINVHLNNISNVKNIHYNIYNILGSSVMSNKISRMSSATNAQINVESLPAGIYMLEINIDGVSSARKVVIQ